MEKYTIAFTHSSLISNEMRGKFQSLTLGLEGSMYGWMVKELDYDVEIVYVRVDKEIAGWAGIAFKEGYAFETGVFVDKKYRGLKIGKTLMSRIAQRITAKEIYYSDNRASWMGDILRDSGNFEIVGDYKTGYRNGKVFSWWDSSYV